MSIEAMIEGITTRLPFLPPSMVQALYESAVSVPLLEDGEIDATLPCSCKRLVMNGTRPKKTRRGQTCNGRARLHCRRPLRIDTGHRFQSASSTSFGR